MKIAFVEMSGFRGFKEKTRFELGNGFVVLTGRNGVGKSTVLDAIDFVVTGTINKFSVKGAKGGGLENHIWWIRDDAPAAQYVTVGFVDENGEEFVITRSRTGGLNVEEDSIARGLCFAGSPGRGWRETMMQTTLIRDEMIAALSLDLPEQARFLAVREAIGGLTGTDYTERTGALTRAAASAKAEQEERVAHMKSGISHTLTELTEARSIAGRQADVSEAEQIVKTFAPDLVGSAGERTEVIRGRIADRKQSISSLNEAIAKAEDLKAERLRLESKAGEAEMATARAEVDAARSSKERAIANLTVAQDQYAADQEGDLFASHMVALLEHGESLGLQDGHCPLCDAVRSSEEFSAAMGAARSNLSARGERAARALAAFEQARLEVGQTEMRLTAAEQRLRGLEERRAKMAFELAKVAETFNRWAVTASPAEPEIARRMMLQRQEETARLEHALFILEASSAHDRVTALETRLEHLRAQDDVETSKLAAAERAVEAARQIDSAAKEVGNQILAEQFDTVLPLLKELYLRLRPHMDWREIETDFGGRVRASLNFTVGDGQNPQFLFSSGQRRAAGIAFLLAIHLSRPWCRLRSLLLDDPVQHIDDYRALNLVEVLSAIRKTGRQVIVAVEDPALADVLCRRLRSTTTEVGRRFELGTAKNGSASIERVIDIHPLPRQVLQVAEA